MVGKWLVVLPLLMNLKKVTLQPVTQEYDSAGSLPLNCCPCPDSTKPHQRARAQDVDCSCENRAEDADTSASVLLPVLRNIQPFLRQTDQKTEQKPLLQPEVGLASSVLETLRQATDEEYQEALARDATRSAVRLVESALNPLDDALIAAPKKKISIFLNTNGDDFDDNLPEPSHIQETRCVHPSVDTLSHPTPVIGFTELSGKPPNKLINLHKNLLDMDNEIGASNIQERVTPSKKNYNLKTPNLKSNPALSSLLGVHQIAKEPEYDPHVPLHKWEEHLGDSYNQNQKIKPNIHLKLRELIDNLDITSNKEKFKVPFVGLKQHISTTTPFPPVKFKPMERKTDNKKPLLLRDLLNLKDVEILPKNNIITGTPSHKNLKLQSDSSIRNKLNPVIDNCKENTDNPAPLNNEDVKKIIRPILSEFADAEISPTILKPVYELENNEVNNNLQKKPTESSLISENINVSPRHLEDQDNLNFSDINTGDDLYKEQYFLDNCKEVTGLPIVQEVPKDKQGPHWNGLQNKQLHQLEENGDVHNEKSNHEDFQIELLEDFDTPIEYDNNSFNQMVNFGNNGKGEHSATNHEIQKNVFDAVAESSIDDLQIEKQNIETNDMCEENLKNVVSDIISQKSSYQNYDFFPEDQGSMVLTSRENTLVEHESTEGELYSSTNNLEGLFSEINEDSSQVSFKDLQDMSNSILNLSESKLLREQTVRTENNLNEEDKSSDVSIIALPEIDKHSSESKENVCHTSIIDGTPFHMNATDINDSNTDNNEMRAEASELQLKTVLTPTLKSYDTAIPLQNGKYPNIFTKNNAGSRNILNSNKHVDFLNNLKLKMENLFSKTDTSDIFKSEIDNNGESSIINPIVVNLDNHENVDKLHRSLQTLPRGILSATLPGIFENNNNLALPNFKNQPLVHDTHNIFKPLKVSGPFENTLEPSLIFNALSDRLRSHTEDTIQNVKETLESTLRDTQHIRLGEPVSTIDAHGVVEDISNKRNEMKEKLDAIHLDLKDRFSSFQRSVLDHFNLPPGSDSDFQGDSSTGTLKAINLPTQKGLPTPKTSKFGNVKGEQDFLRRRKPSSKYGHNTEISFINSKAPIVSHEARFRIPEKKQSLEKSATPSTITTIPSFIPRPKVLKSNIDSTPRLTTHKLSKPIPSKNLDLSEERIMKRPLSLQPERTSKLTEVPYSSLRSPPKINLPIKSTKKNIDVMSTDSPLNKFRKTLRDQNEKSENKLTKSNPSTRTSALQNNNRPTSTIPASLLGRIKEGKPKVGSKKDDELLLSPSSHLNTMHSPQEASEDGFRIVEPLKENVPYKCKLICYKDS